jgi:Na+-driven multidrug efflux pump
MQRWKKVWFYLALVGVILIIIALWSFSSQIARFPEAKGYSVTNMADAYSGVNALFAGLAFAGVVITMILQNSDLNDANKELARTAQINAGMLEARQQCR